MPVLATLAPRHSIAILTCKRPTKKVRLTQFRSAAGSSLEHNSCCRHRRGTRTPGRSPKTTTPFDPGAANLDRGEQAGLHAHKSHVTSTRPGSTVGPRGVGIGHFSRDQRRLLRGWFLERSSRCSSLHHYKETRLSSRAGGISREESAKPQIITRSYSRLLPKRAASARVSQPLQMGSNGGALSRGG